MRLLFILSLIISTAHGAVLSRLASWAGDVFSRVVTIDQGGMDNIVTKCGITVKGVADDACDSSCRKSLNVDDDDATPVINELIRFVQRECAINGTRSFCEFDEQVLESPCFNASCNAFFESGYMDASCNATINEYCDAYTDPSCKKKPETFEHCIKSFNAGTLTDHCLEMIGKVIDLSEGCYTVSFNADKETYSVRNCFTYYGDITVTSRIDHMVAFGVLILINAFPNSGFRYRRIPGHYP